MGGIRGSHCPVAPLIPRLAMPSLPESTPVIAHVGSGDPAFRQLWRFALAPLNGALRPLTPVEAPPCASWLHAVPQRGRLYAVHEWGGAGASVEGLVSVHAPGPAATRCLQQRGSGAAGPVHLEVHEDALLIAHYAEAVLAQWRLDAQGLLQEDGACWASDPDPCRQVAEARPAFAPPGRRASSGHDAAHLHMVRCSPDGRHVLATDLGLDRVQVWRRTDRGALQALAGLAMAPGSGPRHFVFSPGRADRLHVLCETSSTLVTLAFDASDGRLEVLDEISVLPAGFAGTSYASDLLVAPDGRHLYALNRLFDAVSILGLDPGGMPQLRDHIWTRGAYPRSAALDPAGRFLYVCNERSDHLAVLRVEAGMGLAPTGLYVPVPRPLCVHLGRW